MKTILTAWLALPLACSIGTSKLTLSLGNEPLVADGTTTRTITVCNESDEPASNVTATLHASTGSWQGGKAADPQSIDLALTAESRCATAEWVPPTQVGSVSFEAAVAGAVLARESARVSEARVESLALRSGLLSATDASSLSLSIDFTTATGGEVTAGTIVSLHLASSTPVGQAYLSDSSIIVGKRDTVTLFAAAGTTSVNVEAWLKSNASVKDCKIISVTSVATCQ